MGFDSFLNEGKVFTEVTDEGRAFQNGMSLSTLGEHSRQWVQRD